MAGRLGDTLLEACARHGKGNPLEYEGQGTNFPSRVHQNEQWVEDVFGEGTMSAHCHIIVPEAWYTKLPPADVDELAAMQLNIDKSDLTQKSRLASQVVLTKNLEGLLFYVPDQPPNEVY